MTANIGHLGAAKTGRGTFATISVGWFVLLVLADGLLTNLQSVLSLSLPVEIIGRAVILLQFLAVLLFSRTRAPALPGYVVAAILLSGSAMILPPLLSLATSDNSELVLRTFYFMSGISFLILFVPFVPIEIARSAIYPVFFAICMAFGAMQVIQQDLFLSDAAKVAFGLQFELFSNGRIRAVSLFASAPRFAEMISFVALCLFVDMLAGKRLLALRLALYVFSLWLLYNTFSRSGYILLATGTMAALLLARHDVLSARRIEVWGLRVGIATASLMLAVLAVTSVDFRALEIYDMTSMLARLNRWALDTADIGTFTAFQFLFGNGDAPLFSRSDVDYFAIDNLLLILLRYGGLLSVIAFLLLFMSIFFAGLSEVRKGGSALLRPLLAFQVGLFFQSLFVDNHNTIYLVLFVILALVSANRMRLWRQSL